MQEDRPLVPRIVERLLQFFGIGQDAEAALGVRVSKRIGLDRSRFGRLWFLAHSQFQQSFLRLLGQVLDDVEQGVLGEGSARRAIAQPAPTGVNDHRAPVAAG